MLNYGFRVPKRTAFAFVLAAGLMITGVTSASAGRTTPFRGSITENLTGSPSQIACFNDSCANAASPKSGHITTIGNATEAFVGVISAASDSAGCHPDSATGVITNTDSTSTGSIFVSSAGKLCVDLNTGTGTDDGVFVIEGGTGNFVGATGGGVYKSMVSFAPPTPTNPNSSETYNGFITLPGSD